MQTKNGKKQQKICHRKRGGRERVNAECVLNEINICESKTTYIIILNVYYSRCWVMQSSGNICLTINPMIAYLPYECSSYIRAY